VTDVQPFVVERPGVHPGAPGGTTRIPVGDQSALVDTVDYGLVAGYRWRILRGHAGKVYAYARVAGRLIYMHRLVAGTPAGMETDHINGDGLDNRRANLRPATPSQNRANTGKPRRPDGSRPSSRFKGVSWHRGRGKWVAKLAIRDAATGERRYLNLGRYESEEAAARAYDAAAVAQWGAFARPNFPMEASA
jgi:hypothetical protein